MAAGKGGRFHHDGDLVAAVDIGGSKALCMIARLIARGEEESAAAIVGVGLHGIPQRERGGAWLHAAETSLRVAVEAAERMAGARLRAVMLAVPGLRLTNRRIGVDLDLAGGCVTREDVADCLAEGARAASGESAALHTIPVGWRVDAESAGADPVGLAGTTLTAEILQIRARAPHFANYESLIERCGLRLSGALAAPFAAGEAVLVEDEKELGVVMIDIGAASTDYAVYENGALVDCGGAPIGGDHITRDIAQIFGAPIASAERVKTLQGSALTGPGDEHRLVEILQLGADGEMLRVTRAELSAVIAPRLEEIFELVAARLPEAVRSRFGVRRVVLTGGGSLLVGAREAAERILTMKSRIGRPAPIPGAPESARAPHYSACSGAILLAARGRARNDDIRAVAQRRRASAGGVLGGVSGWLRDHF